MKKYIVTPILILITAIQVKAQKRVEQVFTSVPVTNGKVVFRQFIYTGSESTPEQKYALLYQWAKDNYTGNPHLISLRFNNENLNITVSSKTELNLSGNNGRKNKKMLMSYRLDASITNAGCIFVVRDINYEQIDTEGNSSSKRIFTAEEMITDAAIASSSGEQKELKLNLQKQTLTFVNELYNNLSSIFN
jgi:hypothetical protein